MSKKDEKYLLADDSFFLCLHIMGYPHGKKGTLFFSDFADLKYKNTTKAELLTFILALRDYAGFELKNPTDKNSFLWKIATKYTLAQARRFFKQHSSLETKELFKSNDFQIIVSKKTQQMLRKTHNEYIESFINDKLIGYEKNHLPFENQKDLLIEKIASDVDKYGQTLIFHDSDMPEGCNFFYIMLALEKMNYLKIKHIIGASETSNFFYKIIFDANEKVFSINKNEKPICEISKGFGFLKFGKKGKRIKISKFDSQPFRLLSFLNKPFGSARSIDGAFEVIQTEHRKKSVLSGGAYLNMGEKIKALETVKKELQKIKGFTRTLKINIDKERKIIWLSYKK